ncbi:hypothetical protein BT93_G0668 [Corymbia citriodora subsp. variegata]|nr:hypothetical protein BT93_G0668 [Corymbia citriodora subsp. variegata]
MESHKTLHLLALVFSLVMIEKSMASRILFTDYPPPPDNDHSKIDSKGSPPRQDNHWNGNGSDQGTVMVPPPATQTKMKQAGTPDMSAKAVVVAPKDAQVDVSAAASPTSATSSASVTRNSNSSSTTVTNGGTVSTSSSERFSARSSSSVTKYP